MKEDKIKNIVINGFGRIGRIAFRELIGSDEYKVVAINSRSNPEELAYLLKYDTVHGRFNEESITFNEEGLIVDGELIKTYIVNDAVNCPWKELEVDCVLECTGAYTKEEKAYEHIKAGAKHVLLSAPGKGNIKTIVYGVNHEMLDGTEKIISASSCTTNALAPIIKIINDNYKIESGFMTTIHAYTNDQVTMDGTHSKGSKSRRGRAAAQNIIPTSTGAASSIGLIIPEVNGLLDGTSFRVPVINGSCLDLTLNLQKETTKEEVNQLIKNHSNEVLKLTLDPIVSSDIIGNSCGVLVDGLSTKTLEANSKLLKIVAWYDNEYGYTAQMLRTMEVLLRK
ncbi:MAG: type I glyceraldehyde-3-phosphate dehydrogenase [Bacilli bacterium]|nr:type I glyceraldehyde-3-phosphate dehydrogenase [Bacilli bacterium]